MKELYPVELSYSHNNEVRRVDLVFDVYKGESIKNSTSENPGKGREVERIKVGPSTYLPND